MQLQDETTGTSDMRGYGRLQISRTSKEARIPEITGAVGARKGPREPTNGLDEIKSSTVFSYHSELGRIDLVAIDAEADSK
ncbi:hypothetical protein A1F94_008710 [Pyrenophora tritici-repentis]|nr:hypothetical protein PtrV1_05642 [Pyrenophora tritici-repentis]KAF7450385.1 hypothetical protein A1F99_050010 [Pyrenophora tritici-repentis]KAG9381390.1 hypothetical protein A1F94_008710 [Pyrenophora tritici-repentis]KAI0574830.1 hypothetical protein Alg215_08370 [Pyrenophora tritici-repentis]KAI0579652.1 hypothetical protein Alg130_07406 [Pyrenophora tritici-repentis]